jgi:Tectonin domain
MMKRLIILLLCCFWSLSIFAQWEQIEGKAQTIDVGPEGTVWCLGWNKVNGGYTIHRWTGSQWENIEGGAVRLDVGPNGNPWVVNEYGEIFKWTGSTWQLMPGQATDISIGANGTVWCLGTGKANGGYEIFRWNGAAWEKMDGAAVRIDVDRRGYPWAVNEYAQVYSWTGSGWQFRPEHKGKEITVDYDGTVWYLGTNGVPGGYSIYKLMGAQKAKIEGGLVNISTSAGQKGYIWGTNSEGTIFRQRKPSVTVCVTD